MHGAILFLKQLRPLLVMVISAIVLSCASDDESASTASAARQLEPFTIQVIKNGTLTPGLPVRFELFDNPRLGELALQENLRAVIANASDEFERILLLKEWVAAQWPHSVPDPYPPWDAIVVLDWIRRGVTGGFCGQYSQVLLQSLAAIGLTGRYVEIGWTEYPYAHFVLEVWSNQFNKWIMLDADYNIHFERSGTPMSALEIHDAYVRSDFSGVAAILGAFREGHAHPSNWPHETASLYYYLRYHLKADHLSMPNEPPFDRYNDMMGWDDEYTVMWEDSEVVTSEPKVRLTNLRTGDREAASSPLNQVQVSIESKSDNEVVLRFENNVLQFLHYQLRARGEHAALGEWRAYDGDVFRWRPSRSTSILEIRGVNIMGVAGPTSIVGALFESSEPGPN